MDDIPCSDSGTSMPTRGLRLAPSAAESSSHLRHESLMTRLRDETQDAHESTEDVPFSRAIVAQRLPVRCYFGQLHCLRPVYAELESSLANSAHPAIRGVWHDGLRKLDLIEADLAWFRQHGLDAANPDPGLRSPSGPDPDMARAEIAASDFVGMIESCVAIDPVALLGVLYVFEGSTMGATVLRRHLGEAFGLSRGRGLDYYSVYGNDVRQHWSDFRRRMDSGVRDRHHADRIVQAARSTFACIGSLLNCLYPMPV